MQNCPRGKLTSPRLMLCSRPRLVHQQDENPCCAAAPTVSAPFKCVREKRRFAPSPVRATGGPAPGFTSLRAPRGRGRSGQQLRVQVLDLCALGEQKLLEAADLRLLGRHSEKWHQIGRAALQTCTMCAQQKAMFNRTYISSLTSIYSARSK